MPTKHIYVSDEDAKLFDKASEYASSASAAVVEALKLYINSKNEVDSSKAIITLEVDGKKQTFVGNMINND